MPYRSMLRTGELACLEMKMIGKPYAGELQVRFDEGEQDFILWKILNGHAVGNDGYSQGQPKESCACSLLYDYLDCESACPFEPPSPSALRSVEVPYRPAGTS